MEFDFTCQCCFCGEGIAEDADAHELDPCAVILVGNWKKAPDRQVDQQYFCHLACFKAAVEKHAPVDVEELAAAVDKMIDVTLTAAPTVERLQRRH